MPLSLIIGLSALRSGHVSAPSDRLQENTAVFVRGGSVLGQSLYDVEDATIDRARPKQSLGGEYTLEGGPSQVILIRFGDLSRVLPVGAKASQVKLELSPVGGALPKVAEVDRVSRSWWEGPATTLAEISARNRQALGAPLPPTPWGAVTWNAAHVGINGGEWDQPGASGPRDSQPLEGVSFQVLADGNLQIVGLDSAVQAMIDHPALNDGFAIRLSTASQFASSESPFRRPTLSLSYSVGSSSTSGANLAVLGIAPTAGQRDQWQATVANLGDKPVNGLTTEWRVNGTPGSVDAVSAPIGPHGLATFTFTMPGSARTSDPRSGWLTFIAKPAGASVDSKLESATVETQGLPVDFVLPSGDSADDDASRLATRKVTELIQYVNDVCLARSRFSFATDGCLLRLRVGQRLASVSQSGSSNPVVALPASFVENNLGADSVKAVLKAVGAPSFLPPNPQPPLAAFQGQFIPISPGITGGGDTRFEGGLPATMPMSQSPVTKSAATTGSMDPMGPLDAVTVGAFNAGVGHSGSDRTRVIESALNQWPAVNFLDVSRTDGVALGSLKLTVTPLTQGHFGAVKNCAADARGLAVLPDSLGVAVKPEYLLVSGSVGDETAYGWIAGWQLTEDYLRGAKGVSFSALSIDLPSLPIDHSVDWASGKAVTATGFDAVDLSSITATGPGHPSVALNSTATATETDPPAITVDLYRDRVVGEVRLTFDPGAMWKSFKVQLYGTGDSIKDAFDWAVEADSTWSVACRAVRNQDGTVTLRYHGDPQTARYIRIVQAGGSQAKLTKIECFSPVIAAGK